MVNFELAVALAFVAFLWRINKWVSLFLLITTISMIIPFYDKASYFAFQAVFYALIWYALIIGTVHNVNPLLNAICIIALFNVAFMILQFFGIYLWFQPLPEYKWMIYGFSGNSNTASALLAFCFPAFLRKKWKVLIPLVLLGLVLAKSTGGVAAIACGLIFYLWILGHRIPMVAVLVGVAGYIGFIDRPHGSEHRFIVIKETLEFYTEHWVFGSGIGHFKVQVGKYLGHISGKTWSAVHNEFVQGLFEMGIAFPVIVLGYYNNVFKRFSKEIKAVIIPATALIVISINCMVHFSLHIASTAIIAVTWLSILEIELRKNGRNNSIIR